MITLSASILPKVYSGNFKTLILWADITEEKIKYLADLFVDTSATEDDLKILLAKLGLAYAVLIFDKYEKTATVIVGHRNIFPIFFSQSPGVLNVRDRLPVPTRSEMLNNLNSDGFADFVARTIVTGPYELSCHTETFDKRWQAIPPGYRFVFNENYKIIKCDAFDDVYEGVFHNLPSLQIAADEFRHAIDQNLLEISQQNIIASEFSGGIDSGIVRSRCIQTTPEKYTGAITCNYPYVEFRREDEMQKNIIKHCPGVVKQIGHKEFLPFSGIEEIPRHGEPTVASTAWGTFSHSAKAAQQMGATILLNGHGGDTLFRWHPNQKINYKLPDDLLAWLSKKNCKDVTDRAEAIATSLNSRQDGNIGGIWNPGMFDPYRPTILFQCEKSAISYKSGLVSRETLRKGARFWLTNPPLDPSFQKPVARFAFRNDLPESVWSRPGKVDHLGIVFRGAIAAAKPILEASNRNSEVIDELGAKGEYFRTFANKATAGFESDNMMFSIMLSVVIWADKLLQITQQDSCEFKYIYNF